MGKQPGRLICSSFVDFADDDAQEQAAQTRQIRYYQEYVIHAFPGDPLTAPPSYRLLHRHGGSPGERATAGPEEGSVLIGSPAHMTDVLHKVSDAGFDEVILSFDVGLKPHGQVEERTR